MFLQGSCICSENRKQAPKERPLRIEENLAGSTKCKALQFINSLLPYLARSQGTPRASPGFMDLESQEQGESM